MGVIAALLGVLRESSPRALLPWVFTGRPITNPHQATGHKKAAHGRPFDLGSMSSRSGRGLHPLDQEIEIGGSELTVVGAEQG